MRVLFDFELEHYPQAPALNQKSQAATDEIRRFISQRFDELKLQIAKEEKERGAFVLLIFLEGDAQIAYYKYTDELTKKMQDSLSQDDIDYLNIRLGRVARPSLKVVQPF